MDKWRYVQRMTLRSLPVAVAALLALSACGGESPPPSSAPSSVSEGVASSADDRGPVPTADLGALGARLKGWEGCTDEPEVDMAGYPVLVCMFPDEYAVPGQDGNAVRLMTFKEWDQADTYMADYGTPDVTVVEAGYIVDGPHSKAVNAAVKLLKE